MTQDYIDTYGNYAIKLLRQERKEGAEILIGGKRPPEARLAKGAFYLPTIVAGLTLLTLYGPSSPIGLNVAFTSSSRARKRSASETRE